MLKFWCTKYALVIRSVHYSGTPLKGILAKIQVGLKLAWEM